MNTGWRVMWILVAFLNQILNYINGYNISTWQNWASVGLILLAFMCGANDSKED